jgi:4-hydroxybenzoate polyprenyltransferase
LQTLIGLLRLMRPKQWTKNVLIYAGLVFDGQLFNRESFIIVTISFVLLCLAASTIYVVNDLADIERDRQHPRKRLRPLPSGQVSVPVAVAAAIFLPVISIGGAALLNPRYALVLILFIALHVMYSFWIKHIVLLDLLTITAGYVLRVAAGVLVIDVARFSPWLYTCTALLALFLIIGKRRQELLMLGADASNMRPIFKQYNLPLLDELLRMVTTSILIAYILYTIEAPSLLLAGNNLALITIPFVMYALFRYQYLIHVKGEGSAPDEVLFRDRPLLASIVLWGITFVVILYLPNAIVYG